jgi:hypothetical protein
MNLIYEAKYGMFRVYEYFHSRRRHRRIRLPSATILWWNDIHHMTGLTLLLLHVLQVQTKYVKSRAEMF